jgi:hypothetical protein
VGEEMKHKHSELIKQIADDTSLVKLYKHPDGWRLSMWKALFEFSEEGEYHLAHPERVEVALHYLNGGTVQFCENLGWKDYISDRCEPDFLTINTLYRVKPGVTYVASCSKFSEVVENYEGSCDFYMRMNEGTVYPLADLVELAVAYTENNLWIEVPI